MNDNDIGNNVSQVSSNSVVNQPKVEDPYGGLMQREKNQRPADNVPTFNTKNIANQVSVNIITIPNSNDNEEDMTTEKLAPFIEKNEQRLYLKGSSEDAYAVNATYANKVQGYNEINQRLPYTMSPDSEVKEKPADQFSRFEHPIPKIPYVKSSNFTSEKDLIKNLKKDESLLPKEYWEKREAYQSLIEDTGDIGSILGGVGGGVAGGVAGTFTSPVTGVAGPIVGGVVGGTAGAVYGEIAGEDYVAPAVHRLNISNKEAKKEDFIELMKEVYQSRFSNKWEHMDIAKTMKMYPPGPQREALFEAFMDRPKVQKYYSVAEREGLHKTVDKSGETGRLLPGSDPDKRPPIGLDIGGDFQSAVIAGFYGDAFLNDKFKNDLLNNKKLHLSPDMINKASDYMSSLRRSGMAVLPRVELFYDVNSGGTNLIVYARPNQIAGLLSDKTLGEHIKQHMKELPKKLAKMNETEMETMLKSKKDVINSGFRVSIPLKGSVRESLENMNVGYYFEKTLFESDRDFSKAARKLVNQFGAEVNVAGVIRTIPKNELHNYPKGQTYFSSFVAYASNEGDMSNKPDEKDMSNKPDEKEPKSSTLKKIKGITSIPKAAAKAVGKAVGYAATKFTGEGVYLAVGGYWNIASIDPTGKVINDAGHEVYTTNADFSITGVKNWVVDCFVTTETTENNQSNDYYMLPEAFTDLLDVFNPTGH